jgi:uncharacterized membrane protein YoaK (UPF0700 family)
MTSAPLRRQARLAVTLAAVADCIDAVGLLTLAGLFTAHMSGNTARLGADLGGGRWDEAAPYAVAVAIFLLGIGGGAALGEWLGTAAPARRLPVLLLTEAALLAVLVAYGATVVAHGRSTSRHSLAGFYVPAALAILAMGLQASALSRVGDQPVRTTYISGLLTNLAQQAVAWLVQGREPDAARRVRLLAGVAVAYLCGATVGGLLEGRLALWSLSLPAVALARTACACDPEP